MDAGEGQGSFWTARLESGTEEEQISLICRGSLNGTERSKRIENFDPG